MRSRSPRRRVEWRRLQMRLAEKSRATTQATTHPAALCRRDGVLHLWLNLPAWKHRLVVHRVNRKIASQVKNVQSTGPAPGNTSNLKLIFQRRQAGTSSSSGRVVGQPEVIVV